MTPETEIISPIERLREFALWAKSKKLCNSESDFERKCGLCARYIANNLKGKGSKGNLGTESLGKIIRIFPQLNLTWICTGEGGMLVNQSPEGFDAELNTDYRQAYEGAVMQIEALNRILRRRNV